MQYLYEDEYDPKLTHEAYPGAQGHASHAVLIGAKPDGSKHPYQYGFPHTCQPGCPPPRHIICPHHSCTSHTCQEACVNFVCEVCCPELSPATEHERGKLLLHAQLYSLADKFDVKGLKELATKKFSVYCSFYWNDADFPLAAYHVFSSTPDNDTGLRDIVSRKIMEHIDLLNKAEVEAILHEFNGLATDILKRGTTERGWA